MRHPFDIRLARLEGAYDQVSDRLNSMDRRLADLGAKLDSTRDTLVSRMDRHFFGVVGLIMISTLLPIAERTMTR